MGNSRAGSAVDFRTALLARFEDQQTAAAVLEVHKSTISRWCSGERAVPRLVWKVLMAIPVLRRRS